MSFFRKIKSAFTSKPDEKSAVTLAKSPLGIETGTQISFSESLPLLLQDTTKLSLPAGDFVYSTGVVDLGEGERLHRFYLDNEDYWIQIQTYGYDENQVKNIVLFAFLSCQFVNSEAELERLAGKGSNIGMPDYVHDGVTYTREWGTENGQTDFVSLTEAVQNPDESYEVKHLSMLYARETELTNRREFLLFSVEEKEGAAQEPTVSLTCSLGVTLFSTDINCL